MSYIKEKRKKGIKERIRASFHFPSFRLSLSRSFSSRSSGFTLIELMVSIGIFIFLTALVVANYGSFNDDSLLTSMAYDVALAMRDAQSYGLNVQAFNSGNTFNYPYGMDFTSSNSTQMTLFADAYPSNGNNSYGDGVYNASSGDSAITVYTFARGGSIKCLYVSNSTLPTICPTTGNTITSVDITFKRPNPNAIIRANGDPTGSPYAYAEIQIQNATKTSTRSIIVNETGEIAVQNQ